MFLTLDFLQHIPKLTVDAWKQLGQKLNPKLLIPSLINCTQVGDLPLNFLLSISVHWAAKAFMFQHWFSAQ